jgi:hypothetical protein
MVGQIAQNAWINVVLGKALGVLPQAKCVEPVRNLLHWLYRLSGRLAEFWTTAKKRNPNLFGIACLVLRHSAATGPRSLPNWCMSTGACYQTGHGMKRTTELLHAPDFGSKQRCTTRPHLPEPATRLEPQTRFTRGDVKDHIVSSKIDHGPQ